MRKILRLVSIFVFMGLLAAPAAVPARDFDGDRDYRIDTDNDFDLRPYVGGGIGGFGLELKNATVNQKETVFGGYGKIGVDIGDYLGAELRFGSTGSGTTGNIKLSDSYFLSYLGKVQFPVTPDFRVFGMIGGTTARFKKTVSGVEAAYTETGLSYGGGAEYYVQDVLSVGGEWTQYWTNVNILPTDEVKIWGATATLSYHF